MSARLHIQIYHTPKREKVSNESKEFRLFLREFSVNSLERDSRLRAVGSQTDFVRSAAEGNPYNLDSKN